MQDTITQARPYAVTSVTGLTLTQGTGLATVPSTSVGTNVVTREVAVAHDAGVGPAPWALCATVLACWGLRWLARRREDPRGSADGLDPVQAAYLKAGAGNAARTVVVGLMCAREGARLQKSRDATVRFAYPEASLPDHLVPYGDCTRFGDIPHRRLLDTVTAMLPAVARDLRAKGLLRTDGVHWGLVWAQVALSAACAVVAVASAVATDGGAQLACFGVLVATVVNGVVVTVSNDPCTRAGRNLVDQYALQHARESVSPLRDELTVGYAMGGTNALKGTALDGYGDSTWYPGS